MLRVIFTQKSLHWLQQRLFTVVIFVVGCPARKMYGANSPPQDGLPGWFESVVRTRPSWRRLAEEDVNNFERALLDSGEAKLEANQ